MTEEHRPERLAKHWTEYWALEEHRGVKQGQRDELIKVNDAIKGDKL